MKRGDGKENKSVEFKIQDGAVLTLGYGYFFGDGRRIRVTPQSLGIDKDAFSQKHGGFFEIHAIYAKLSRIVQENGEWVLRAPSSEEPEYSGTIASLKASKFARGMGLNDMAQVMDRVSPNVV